MIFWGYIMMASAAPCTTTTQQALVVSSSSTTNLLTVFDCEGGNFEVTWSGVVNVTGVIPIGVGTTVSISGDHNNAFNASDVDSSGAGGVGTATGSATVRTTGLGFGPMFELSGSSLSLNGVLVRNGDANSWVGNSTVSGGGVSAINSNVSVVGCTFEDNFAELSGGGIYAKNSRLIVSDTVFRRCVAGTKTIPGDENAEAVGGGIAVSF